MEYSTMVGTNAVLWVVKNLITVSSCHLPNALYYVTDH